MNKYHLTYRFIAGIMACLILLTSVGACVDMHFCQGNLKSFSLVGKAKSCYQLIDSNSKKQCCSKHQQNDQKPRGCSIGKKACCHDKMVQLISEYDMDIPSNSVMPNQEVQSFLVAFISNLLQPLIDDDSLVEHFSYKPPLITRDIYVLLETYLL